MTLSPSELRCMGLIPVPFGEMRCTRRNTCARFLERYAEGVTVDLIRMWMCPTKDDYYGAFIAATPEFPREPHASAATTRS